MQIEEIVAKLTAWGKNYKERDPKTHYFSEAHKFRCETAERLSYHAVFDVFPEKLISSAAPNESAAEFNYRKKNYKQKTKAYWDKAIAATNRIFNTQNYTIEWGDEKIKEYFTYTYPTHGDYVQWFIDNAHPEKYADPNAVLVVKPETIPGEMIEDEFVVDQSVALSPISQIFGGEDVFEFYSEYCLLRSPEKSPVMFSSKMQMIGLVFEVYDENKIWKIIQIGDKTDYKFDVIEFYTHNWDQKMAWLLKGIPKPDPFEVLYYSHFQCALSSLDEAAVLNSTAFAVTNKFAFPTRWYYEDSCSVCSGNGWNENYETHNKDTCQTCKGTGKKMTWTWGKDLVVQLPDNGVSGIDTTQLPTPPGGTISGSVDEAKHLDEKTEKLCREAFMNLNIHITDKATGVTATEVEDDKDELISFLIKIAREEFDLMQESIDAHTWLMMSKEQIVEVREPNEFRVRSSADITEELKTAVEAGFPQPYLFKLLEEGIQQRFKNDSQMDQVIKIVSLVDPMMTTSETTIQQLSNTGVLDKWRVNLHYFIYNFIYSELEKNDKFLEGKVEVIKKTLEDMAKAMTVGSGNKAGDILGQIQGGG